MKGLNLSGFKKIASDEHTTTLKHPGGHEIRIAHASLPIKMKEQLHRLPLAEGGPVSSPSGVPGGAGSPALDPKKAKEFSKGASESGAKSVGDYINNIKEGLGIKEAEGGEVPHFAEGTPDEPVVEPIEDEQPQAAASSPNTVPPISIEPVQQQPAQAPLQVEAIPQASQPAVPVQTQTATPPGSPPASGAGKQIQSPSDTPQPTTEDDRFGQATAAKTYNLGLEESKLGMNLEADAAMAHNRAEAQVAAQAAQQQAANQHTYQTHYNELMQERQNFMNDIRDQHIDPQHYMNTLDTGGKFSTALGLIAGGIGGAITHQGNPAQQYLEKQIDNDINAQKADLGKKENLLNANLKQFGNLKDATDMTRVMQLDIMANKFREAAAKTADPAAQARLFMQAGDLDQKSADHVGQLAMRKTLLNGVQEGRIDPETMIRANPYGAPAAQQEAALKELNAAKNMSASKDNLMSAFDKVDKLQTLSNRALNPIQSDAQIKATVEPLMAQLVKDSEGRITPQDYPMIARLMPEFTDSAETKALKRRQLNSFVSEKMNFSNLKSMGVDPSNLGRYNAQGQNRFNERK